MRYNPDKVAYIRLYGSAEDRWEWELHTASMGPRVQYHSTYHGQLGRAREKLLDEAWDKVQREFGKGRKKNE